MRGSGIVSGILLLLLTVLFAGCVRQDDEPNAGVGVGEPLPAFSVTLNDGRIVTNKTLLGHTAVIEFFNTGCGDCRGQLPRLQAFYRTVQDNPEYEVIAIAREEDAASIAAYWQQNGFTVPWSAQTDRAVYNLFATVGIPRVYVADPNGIIVQVYEVE